MKEIDPLIYQAVVAALAADRINPVILLPRKYHSVQER